MANPLSTLCQAALVAFAILLASIAPRAQSGIDPTDIERVGQAGWQFLKINGDARQAALGGAFGALGGSGANSVFGNPAALADVDGLEVALNRSEWVADIGHSSVAVAKNLGSYGVVAVSLASLNYGEIVETANVPTTGQGRTEAVLTGNTFGASDIAGGVSYARQITDRLSVGGSARLVRQQIADASMSNWSVDFGTNFYTGYRSLRIGFAARNFGPDSRFFDYDEEFQSEPVEVRMPVEFRFGTAMDFFDGSDSSGVLTVATNAYQPSDGPPKMDVGAEYLVADVFAIRGGYKFNYDEQNLTVGAGINYSVASYVGQVNYAYVGFGALGTAHTFSVRLQMD